MSKQTAVPVQVAPPKGSEVPPDEFENPLSIAQKQIDQVCDLLELPAAARQLLRRPLAWLALIWLAMMLGLGLFGWFIQRAGPGLVITTLLRVGGGMLYAFLLHHILQATGWLAGPMNFESQGYLTSWARIFFFALVFAISMDYTVFLLASAREHWERSGDPHEAMVGGLAHSGRVIFAAAGVMVAVFFTFALSGPLPPKEMGIILGVAVLLDAFLVRLLLVPVILRLLGTWAWWLPRPLRRILPDVRFGHA